MVPKGSSKGQGLVRAKIPISVINRRLSLDQVHMKGFMSVYIWVHILIYNVGVVKDDRAWDLFYDIIFLDPVMTRQFSQSQLKRLQCRVRSLPFQHRWDNPCDIGDHVNGSNTKTTSFGRIPDAQAVVGAVLAFAMTMKLERLRRTCRLVRPGPGKAVEQMMGRGNGKRLRMGRGMGRGWGSDTVKGKDAPDGFGLDNDGDIERQRGDEQDEDEDDEKEEEEEVDEDEEDEDEDDGDEDIGKQPRTIGHGEKGSSSFPNKPEGGHILPDVPLPDVALHGVALPDAQLPDVPLPHVSLSDVHYPISQLLMSQSLWRAWMAQ
ncbi:hypothetical protein BDD12DRAFT_876118 [Trichophaea hybrida]|nr:hypothetical protein BDD12DRAFT_876118 [Trichophaea hybrida]